MLAGCRVNTEFGPGLVVRREGDKGILSHRFLVKLDNFNNVPSFLDFSKMSERQGGIYFFDSELATFAE